MVEHCAEYRIVAIIPYVFDFHEKRKIKSWLFSKPAIVVLLVVASFLANSVYALYQKERETATKYAKRQAELAELNAHAAALSAEVEYMQSTRGIEEEIRDRFDVVKKGEQAVIVMEQRHPTTSPAAVTSEAQAEAAESFFSWLFFWR